MRILKTAMLLLLFYSSYSLASYSLEHDWSCGHCDSYNDNLMRGTYNFHFSTNGYMHTYIEFYADSYCRIKTGNKHIAASGTYRIKNISEAEDFTSYEIEVKYNHISQVIIYHATVKQDSMTLCEDNACEVYKKI